MAVVQSFYEALARNDISKVESLLDGDSIVVQEAESLPYGGSHQGLAGFRSMLRKLGECWAQVSFSDLSFASGDDLVVAMFVMHAQARATKQQTSFRVVELWRFANEKVVAIEPFYWDTHALRAVLGLQ
jgi:ketosteroid isomerase-like protein